MELVVEGIGKLVPFSNCLCYELFDWREKRGKEDLGECWISTNSYPSTISSGLAMMYNRAVAKNPTQCKDIKEAIEVMRELRRSVMDAQWVEPEYIAKKRSASEKAL